MPGERRAERVQTAARRQKRRKQLEGELFKEGNLHSMEGFWDFKVFCLSNTLHSHTGLAEGE